STRLSSRQDLLRANRYFVVNGPFLRLRRPSRRAGRSRGGGLSRPARRKSRLPPRPCRGISWPRRRPSRRWAGCRPSRCRGRSGPPGGPSRRRPASGPRRASAFRCACSSRLHPAAARRLVEVPLGEGGYFSGLVLGQRLQALVVKLEGVAGGDAIGLLLLFP